MTNRYDTSHSFEGQFQSGSNDRVLKNKLDIIDSLEMDDVELTLLEKIQVSLLDEIEIDQQITAKDLCNWHRGWLGDVYEWAGNF